MSFSDPYGFGDLLRVFAQREGVVLTSDQVCDLVEAIEGADESELEAAYQDGMDNAECDCDEEAAFDDGYAAGKEAAEQARRAAGA